MFHLKAYVNGAFYFRSTCKNLTVMCSSTQGANVALQGDVLCLATHLAHYSTSSCARVLSPFSRVQLCAALWTAAARLLCQVFSRQEDWSGLPCPLQIHVLRDGQITESG